MSDEIKKQVEEQDDTQPQTEVSETTNESVEDNASEETQSNESEDEGEDVGEKALEILSKLAQEEKEDTEEKTTTDGNGSNDRQQQFMAWVEQVADKLLEDPKQAVLEIVQVLNTSSAKQAQMYLEYYLEQEDTIAERLEARAKQFCEELGIDMPPASVIQREARAVLRGKRNESDALLKVLGAARKSKRRGSKTKTQKSTPPAGVGSGKPAATNTKKSNVIKTGDKVIWIPTFED